MFVIVLVLFTISTSFAILIYLSLNQKQVNNFTECVNLNGVVMESYPRQCAYNGKTFAEDVTLQKGSTENIVSEITVIQTVKDKYPEYSDYPSDSLPPKSIKTQYDNETWYIAFVQEGSGVPIIKAKCFSVGIDKSVNVIGEYDSASGIRSEISPKTCK
jgi:hypothetical protein